MQGIEYILLKGLSWKGRKTSSSGTKAVVVTIVNMQGFLVLGAECPHLLSLKNVDVERS